MNRVVELISHQAKLFVGLALVASGGLVGQAQGNIPDIPVVSAPMMHQCREAEVKDLGVWDDALRFEDQDVMVLRRGDSLFSYSLATGRRREIRLTNNLAGVHLIDGITWKKHQWIFCQSRTSLPFAIDLASGKTATFEMPGVSPRGMNGPNIDAIIHSAVGPATIVAISGDAAPDWPRKGNWPLYFWLNLASGKVMKFPTGWDLRYFSADQKRAVFENISTNAMMYRPWVTVDMATGDVTIEFPDRTKELWAAMSLLWHSSLYPWEDQDYHRHVWELRSVQAKADLLYPQPGRGGGDTFAGLSVNGVDYPLNVPGMSLMKDCLDAKVAGHLAVFALANDGVTKRWLWAARLGQDQPPQLLATNRCVFEMLGGQRCALSMYSSTAPTAYVYNAASNHMWNILEGVSPSPKSDRKLTISSTNQFGKKILRIATGMRPLTTYRLIAGFGSARYAPKVLCLCSTTGIIPQNMIPPPVRKAQILLTDRGRRYQINLPPELRKVYLDHPWLHNSGKLVINRSGHIYVADLRAN